MKKARVSAEDDLRTILCAVAIWASDGGRPAAAARTLRHGGRERSVRRCGRRLLPDPEPHVAGVTAADQNQS